MDAGSEGAGAQNAGSHHVQQVTPLAVDTKPLGRSPLHQPTGVPRPLTRSRLVLTLDGAFMPVAQQQIRQQREHYKNRHT